jgi:hypothetical protein
VVLPSLPLGAAQGGSQHGAFKRIVAQPTYPPVPTPNPNPNLILTLNSSGQRAWKKKDSAWNEKLLGRCWVGFAAGSCMHA